MREARIQAEVRRQQSEAIGPKNTQQMRSGRGEHRLFLRGAQTRRHYDSGARAEPAQFVNQARHRGNRCADHGKVGRLRQFGRAREYGNALE